MPKTEALGSYSQACIDTFDMLDLTHDVMNRIRKARSTPLLWESFVPIGEISLGDDDMQIHAGVKNRGFSSTTRVAEEMYLGDLLLTHKPGLVEALPMFALPIKWGSEDKGILTEDFTQNGNARLDERKHPFRGIFRVRRFDVPEGLYRDVYDALSGQIDNAEAFGHMMGWVAHREVLVDFNEIAIPSENKIEPYKEIAEALTVEI